MIPLDDPGLLRDWEARGVPGLSEAGDWTIGTKARRTTTGWWDRESWVWGGARPTR